MSEQEKANRLARWLDHGDGAEDLESEVMEAVLALRPDLAPPPNVDIHEILDDVVLGPLSSSAETDAESITALMQWMEQRPGQSPPSDTNPEVIEAVLAMRPDLAPPLQVDMAQILAEVSSGPLAQEPAAEERLISLGTVRSQRQDRKGVAIAIGFGLLAAAATTLFAIRITKDTPVHDSPSDENVVEVAKAIDETSAEELPSNPQTEFEPHSKQNEADHTSTPIASAKKAAAAEAQAPQEPSTAWEGTTNRAPQTDASLDSDMYGSLASGGSNIDFANSSARSSNKNRAQPVSSDGYLAESNPIPAESDDAKMRPPAPPADVIATSPSPAASPYFEDEMELADAVSDMAFEEEPLVDRPSARSSTRSGAPTADYLPTVRVTIQQVEITSLSGEKDSDSEAIATDVQKAMEADLQKSLNRIRSCVNGHVSELGNQGRVLLTSTFQVANQRATSIETNITNSQALPANGVGLPPCMNEAYQSIHFALSDVTTRLRVVVELN